MRRWIAAGAGSGKTESLVAQILDALDGGFAPGEILALTFTRAAAAELKQRVRVRLMAREAGGAAAVDIESLSVATFHAFAAGFLHEEFVHSGEGLAFMLLDELDGADDDDARLHDFVTGDAERNPVRWTRALGLRGLAGSKEIFAKMTAVAADRPEEFAAVLAGLDPAASARARTESAHAALAALEAEAFDLGEVTSPFSAFAEAVLMQLLSVTRNEWPAEPQLTAGLKALDKAGAEGFPHHRMKIIIDAVVVAYKVLQGALLETALEPLLPAAQEFAALRRKELLASGIAGYDDLLRFTAERLRDPDCARRLAARVRCLLVDEAQDTDPVQAQMVMALHGALGADGRIVVVGDEKQAIYRFRGADLASYEALERALAGAKHQALKRNYRSVPEILNFVQRFADENFLEPQSDDAPPLTPPFWSGASALQASKPPACEPRVILLECEADELLDWAAPWLAAHHFAWRDCLFLAHANDKLDEIEHACLHHTPAIPVIRTGTGLWGRETPLALLNAAEAAADPENDLALLAVLRSPLFAVRDEELLAALGDNAETRIPLRELFNKMDARTLASSLRTALLALRRLHEEDAPVAVRLRNLVEASGLAAALHQADYPGALAEREALALSYQLAADSPGLREFAERLRTRKEKDGKTPILPDPSRPGAKLFTIHGAKGLGEKVVFVDARMGFADMETRDHFRMAGAAWGVKLARKNQNTATPGWAEHFAAAEADAHARDRAALAYVALTRAKEWLILWAPKFPMGGNTQPLADRLARFLQWEKGGGRTIPSTLAQWARVESPAAAIARPREIIAVPPPPNPAELSPLPAIEAFSWTAARKSSETKLRGSLLHKAMELWPEFKADEAAAALHSACQALGISGKDPIKVEVEIILRRVAGDPFLRELQAARERRELWRELPLFVPEFQADETDDSPPAIDEEIKFFRRGIADLVYRNSSGEFVIVDYKTGFSSEEKLRDYREQLAGYRNALATAGFAKAKLLLWFVEAGDPVAVA